MTTPDDPNASRPPEAYTPITREALYDVVWSEPMLKVAARFNVSSSYMARVCTLLNVPRPERGYWAKLAVKKAPRKPDLPEARPGEVMVWSREQDAVCTPRSLPGPLSRRKKKLILPTALPAGEHLLLKGAKALFEKCRFADDTGYLKPDKKLLVDLTVSKTGLDKALSFANELFLVMEANGYRVVIAPAHESFRRPPVDEREAEGGRQRYWSHWSPWRSTVVYIGTLAFGLSIIEMSEEAEVRYINGKYVRESDYMPPKRRSYAHDHSWTMTRDFPSGRLCLRAYYPYGLAKWTHYWREKRDYDLTNQIPAIVKTLERSESPRVHWRLRSVSPTVSALWFPVQ